jgi:hypothetical protein
MGRREMQKERIPYTLEERLGGAHDVRVIALGVARAKAVSDAPVLAPPVVKDQMRVHT